MIPLVSIYIGGTLTLVMAIFHTRFYRMFNWKTDFDKVTVLNARIIYTVHLALLLLFFMLGTISIVNARELAQSIGLALGLNLLFSAFWLWRLIWQFVYFKREKRQKVPIIGIILILVFALLFSAYLIPVIYRFLL
jgi:hypothetical protein